MKRTLLRITLCLALGAVTTVAVAWGLAWPSRNDPVIPLHLLVPSEPFEPVRWHVDWGWPQESLGFSYGFDHTNGVMRTTALPLRPILPGFIINTFFYGATWFVLFLGFTRFKRAIRKKRGRCPDCRYDLRGDLESGCPECGWNRPT